MFFRYLIQRKKLDFTNLLFKMFNDIEKDFCFIFQLPRNNFFLFPAVAKSM